jgi:excisionase family DNA binding protein
MSDLLTPDELAARWQRPTEWVRRKAAAGSIPGIKVGGLWRFDPEDIAAYEMRHKNRDPLSMTPLAAKRYASKGGAR